MMLSFIIPLSLGLFFFSSFRPFRGNFQITFLFKFCFAVIFGLGISSCVFFVSRNLPGGTGRETFILTEIVIFLVLMTIWFLKRKKSEECLRQESKNFLSKKEFFLDVPLKKILTIAVYAAIVFAVGIFLSLTWKDPWGGCDAQEIWNVCAKNMYENTGRLTREFFNNGSWHHQDYPLLLPGIIAAGWEYTGRAIPAIPIFTAALYSFVTAGLLFSSLTILRDKTQGVLAMLVLLGTPLFIQHGSEQYADIPLGSYFLAVIVLLYSRNYLPGAARQLLFLAGIAMGFACWTKNEGLLFLAAIISVWFILSLMSKRMKTFSNEISFFLLGLLPVFVIIMYFKVRLAPSNDVVSLAGSAAILPRLMDFSRYIEISKSFIAEASRFGKGLVSPVYLLIAYFALSGTKIKQKDQFVFSVTSISLLFILMGYFFIYVVTPHNLEWHLCTSLHRLFLQIYPSLLFVFFMAVRTPENERNTSKI